MNGQPGPSLLPCPPTPATWPAHRLASSTPARPSQPTAMSIARACCVCRLGYRLHSLLHTVSG